LNPALREGALLRDDWEAGDPPFNAAEFRFGSLRPEKRMKIRPLTLGFYGEGIYG
jgi:hypothetical protein